MAHTHDDPDRAGHDHAGHDHAGKGHAHHDHGGPAHAGHAHGKAAGAGHSHEGGGAHAGHSHGAASEGRTAVAAAITFGFMIVEAIGGVVSGSLALLADAAHMLTDAASLALAWWAFRQLRKPATPRMSFGHDRMPVLVAFANGIALLLVTAWIVVEAIERLSNPVEIDWKMMAGVAVAGLAANIAAFWVLMQGERNLNIRGALLHVASDMLGSVGAVAAAIVIALTGWTPADPILSLVVAMLLLRATFGLIKESAHILLQGAPDGAEGPTIAEDLVASVPGLLEVHHVHVWSLAEGKIHATLHAVADDGGDNAALVRAVKARLADRHGIGHATVEVEPPAACADRVPVTVSE